MPTLTAKLKRGVARDLGLIVLGLFLGALVLMTGRLARDDASTAALHQVKLEAYRQDINGWHGRIAGCQRSKQDRTSIAHALRAQSNYLNLVLKARSVKQDVKDAAWVNQRAQDASAVDLESRTGRNLDCRIVYPKPPTPAGVDELP